MLKNCVKTFPKQFSVAQGAVSDKIVYEHYEKFAEIWGGSPNVTQLSFGLSTVSET